jgi:hypothetical protein
MGGVLIPNDQLMEEHVFAAIGSSRQKKVELPAEAIKVRKLERFRPETELQRRALEQVYAKRFIEVQAGPATWVIYLTHGAKPKVVGVASQ